MTQMSTHREDKEAVVHMNNGLLVAERSQLGSFVQMCVNVVSVVSSEVRKRKTNIIYESIYVGSRKWYR